MNIVNAVNVVNAVILAGLAGSVDLLRVVDTVESEITWHIGGDGSLGVLTKIKVAVQKPILPGKLISTLTYAMSMLKFRSFSGKSFSAAEEYCYD